MEIITVGKRYVWCPGAEWIKVYSWWRIGGGILLRLGVSMVGTIGDDEGKTVLALEVEGKLIREPIMTFVGSHKKY